MRKQEIKQEISKLKLGLIELEHRATGRSTRIIDNIIQKLFDNPDEWIIVADHFDTKQASKMIVDTVRRRLEIEHKLQVVVKNGHNNTFQIKLKNYHKLDIRQEKERIQSQIALLQKLLDEYKIDEYKK